MNTSVEQFQRCCRAIDETTSTAAAYELGAIIEEQLPGTYQVPYEGPPLAGNPLEAAKSRHYRGLWHELVQHLTDLGYLTTHQFITYHALRKDIPDEPRLLVPVLFAVRQYLAEEDWSMLPVFFTGELAKLQLPQIEEHLGQLVERIAGYTSFDGSMLPPPAYQIGAVNCYGRSLAFRMRTLFTLDVRLRDIYIFDRQQLKFLYSFQNLIQLELFPPSVQPEEVMEIPAVGWQLLCHIDLLYERFRDARPEGIRKKKIILFYRLKAGAAADNWLDDDDDFRERKGHRRRMSNASQELVDTGYHEFGIRLLQVKLWQTHFYVGSVDGKWGELSHQAVVSLMAQEEEVSPRKRNGELKPQARKDLENAFSAFSQRGEADDGTSFVIDFVAMFELLQQYHAQPVETARSKTEQADEMTLLLKKLQEEAEVPTATLDERILNSEDFRELYPDPAVKPLRRVAFPRTSFLAGIWRGFKRIANWVAKAVGKLLGPVFGFIKLITGKIRAGIQQFFRGFRYLGYFLLGRPIVTLGTPTPDTDTIDVFATKFSLDFDGINLVSDQARPSDIQRHVDHLQDMKNSMFYFIDTTLEMIKIIGRLAQPGGWVWLGWQIARLVVGDLVGLVQGMA